MFTTIICTDTLEIAHSYSDYLATEHWKMFRSNYIEQYGNDCEHCNSRGQELHHLNYDTLGNEEFDDVIFLCSTCHEKEHYKLD